jgi:hypothetical protein
MHEPPAHVARMDLICRFKACSAVIQVFTC